MSDTPRTDAEEIQIYREDVTGCAEEISYVPARVARELERENAALLLEVQDLELQNNAMRSTSRGKEVAKNKKLERENTALRKDKDRLDWLESRLNSSYVELCHYGNGSQLDGDAARAYDRTKPYYVDGQFGRSGASLRAAIDAARKEAKP
jgi:hypothetical protein